MVRDVLDLTVTIDHNVVDGAPATRFGADLLRRRMEQPATELFSTTWLSPAPVRTRKDGCRRCASRHPRAASD